MGERGHGVAGQAWRDGRASEGAGWIGVRRSAPGGGGLASAVRAERGEAVG